MTPGPITSTCFPSDKCDGFAYSVRSYIKSDGEKAAETHFESNDYIDALGAFRAECTMVALRSPFAPEGEKVIIELLETGDTMEILEI